MNYMVGRMILNQIAEYMKKQNWGSFIEGNSLLCVSGPIWFRVHKNGKVEKKPGKWGYRPQALLDEVCQKFRLATSKQKR
jgi:hypothetical protein